MNKFSSFGFSLMETMVAIGLGGMLSVAFMHFTANNEKEKKLIHIQDESLELRRLVTNTMLDPVACRKTLESRTLGSVVPSILDRNGRSVFQTGQVFGRNQIVIESMVIKSRGVSTGTKQGGILDLTIKASKKFGGDKRNIEIPFDLILDGGTGLIIDCVQDRDQILTFFCESLGGVKSEDKCQLPKCSNGTVLQVLSSGAPVCLPMTCPTGKRFKKFDSNNQPVCVDPIQAKVCPLGEFVKASR
jgi:hypothetical protein